MTTPTTVNVQIQLRADTAANWTAANPTLLANEVGLETDTKKLKVGDGTTAWASLAYFPSIVTGGTVLGNLEIGSTGTLTFEGSTADGFETTLAVTDPTADRTITLPDQSGTVVVSGNASIVDADIAAGAEIAVSKLANGTANQVLVTDGTDVSWSDDLTLAGDLTVNGTTTTINTQDLLVEDKNIIIGNVDTPTDVTADGGGITLKGATDKTINWVDSTDAWTSSERFSVPLGSAASPSLTFTGDENTGIYSPGADQLALSTSGVGRLFIDSSGRALIGTNASLHQNAQLQTAGTGYYGYNHFQFSNDEFAPTVSVKKSRGTTVGTNTIVQNNDRLGTFNFYGADGSSYRLGADITAFVDGTPAANAMPGRLVFSTTPSASATPQERLRITSAGLVGIGSSSPTGKLTVTPIGGTFTTNCNDGDYSTYGLYIEDASTNLNAVLGAIGFGGPIRKRAAITCSSEADLDQSALAFWTQPLTTGSSAALNERMRIDSQGRVGIGTNAPDRLIHLYDSTSKTTVGESDIIRLAGQGTDNTVGARLEIGFNYSPSNNRKNFATIGHVTTDTAGFCKGDLYFTTRNVTTDTAPIERMRLDSSGRLLVGTSSARTNLTGHLQVEGTSSNTASFSLTCNNTSNNDCPVLTLAKSATATVGSNTLVDSGERLGEIQFAGNDGTNFVKAALIQAEVDGTPGSNDMPGRLVFSTTKDGQASPTAWLELNNAGTLKAYDGSGTLPYYSRLIYSGVFGNYGGTSTFSISSVNGNATFLGALSKGSGSFKIDHPLPSKKETHYLVHSFIEGPQADLIYRGHVKLVAGLATVNIDQEARMTEGTFEALCTNVCCFTSNETDWTAVRGKVIGNVLTIEAQDPTSTADICWMVVGERKDKHMLETEWTDENGRVITEPLKPVESSETP